MNIYKATKTLRRSPKRWVQPSLSAKSANREGCFQAESPSSVSTNHSPPNFHITNRTVISYQTLNTPKKSGSTFKVHLLNLTTFTSSFAGKASLLAQNQFSLITRVGESPPTDKKPKQYTFLHSIFIASKQGKT